MTNLLSESEFRLALENAMTGTMAKDASFSRAWATGKLSHKHFRHWAVNHYHYVGAFADCLALMYANTPDTARFAKDFLLQNMYEEELSDDRHTDLLIRFGEACGATRAQIMDRRNSMPYTKGMAGWQYQLSATKHFAVSTAAMIVGLESQVPSIYRTQYPALIDPEIYGFSEHDCEFFDLHITSDEVHGERGYQIVLKYADTPELQQECITIVREAADMRFNYTKSLYETYVKADLGEWVEEAPPAESSLAGAGV
jgi:pyrroloquinoline-quinone synthase